MMRVLVVDDDEAGRYLVASILAGEGHVATEALDGRDALQKARADRPDVLITDILMPHMDGYQLAREWKADPVLASVPLIFLTASYTDPEDEKFAIELGADGFLSKPVDPEMLIEMIDDVTAASSADAARRPADRSEIEILQEYSDRVVHKLEQKLADLERSNVMLESAMSALSQEAEARGLLVAELHAEVARREAREVELQQERDFTRRVVETADVFIVATDLERKITLFSPGAERISGYASDEVMGRDYLELFSPPDEYGRRKELQDALVASEGTQRLTNVWRMRSGEQRVMDWSATVLRDAEGTAAGVIRFGIDVTEREVRTATERVMGVVDLAVLLDRPLTEVVELTCAQAADEFGFAAVWIGLTGDGQPLEVRSAAGSVAPALGLAFEHDPGMACPLGEIAELAGAVAFRTTDANLPAAWVELAAAQRLESAAVVPIRAHGGVIGVVGALAYSAYGFESGFLQALQLLADRLGVAIVYSEAREQLALQSAALESAANAIVIADMGARVLWVNPAFETMTGYQFDQAVGQELLAKGTGYREPHYRDAWSRLEAGEAWRGQVANQTREGVEYTEDVTIAPVKDESGAATHAVIVKQDVSERVRLEHLKSDFVAMVSHELRTPLTTIIGYADLLSAGAGTLDAEKVSSATESIRSSGQRMKRIVEQLLEVTQMQAEGVEVQKAPLDIGHLVTEIAQSVPRTERHQLHLDIPPDAPTIDVDARRLTHALRNIIENAVKYSPDGGTIGVAVHDLEDEVVISVSDEGVGMAEDELPGLFQAFTQQDMTSTRSFGGIGMGLFVAYQFVAAHGGRITVRSRKNQGSTFEIRLPVERD